MLCTQLVGPNRPLPVGPSHLFPLSPSPRARAGAPNLLGTCAWAHAAGRGFPSHISAHAVRQDHHKTTWPNTQFGPNTLHTRPCALQPHGVGTPRVRHRRSDTSPAGETSPARLRHVPHRRPGGPLPGAGTPSARKLYVPPTEHGWKRPGKAASSAAWGGAGARAWDGAGCWTGAGCRGLFARDAGTWGRPGVVNGHW